jgi:hypothetical protein
MLILHRTLWLGGMLVAVAAFVVSGAMNPHWDDQTPWAQRCRAVWGVAATVSLAGFSLAMLC